MAMTGAVGAVYVTSGVSVTFTDEATTKNATYTRYKITNVAKRYWDDTSAITVKKNGVVQSSGFTIEMAGGVIEFTTPLIVTDVVLVSGKYFNAVQCASMFNWKVDFDVELKDTTTFASAGWKEQMAVTKGWSASAEGYWADGTFFNALGTNVIVVLYLNSSTDARYEGYVILKKCSVDVPVDDIVKESLDLDGDGKLYFRDGVTV